MIINVSIIYLMYSNKGLIMSIIFIIKVLDDKIARKQLENIGVQMRRYSDLEYLKSVNGPFTQSRDLEKYMANRSIRVI